MGIGIGKFFKFIYLSKYDKVDPLIRQRNLYIKIGSLNMYFIWMQPYSEKTQQWLKDISQQPDKGEW